MTTQSRFLYLCRKLLELHGNNLYPQSGSKKARLAAVQTPDGKVYVKESDLTFHVSSPGYDDMWSIYHRTCETDAVIWNRGAAAEVVPYLEEKLALDLLADI